MGEHISYAVSAPKVLKRHLAIRVRVPKLGPYMKPMPAFIGHDGKEVPVYWRFGYLLKNKKILNIFFHGIDESFLGKHIVATVEVEKNSGGYVQITCRYMPGIEWSRTMVVRPDKPGDGVTRIYNDAPECLVLIPR